MTQNDTNFKYLAKDLHLIEIFVSYVASSNFKCFSKLFKLQLFNNVCQFMTYPRTASAQHKLYPQGCHIPGFHVYCYYYLLSVKRVNDLIKIINK